MNMNASLYDSIDESKMVCYIYRQMTEDDNKTHLRAFKSNAEVVEHYKVSLLMTKFLLNMREMKLVRMVNTLLRKSY